MFSRCPFHNRMFCAIFSDATHETKFTAINRLATCDESNHDKHPDLLLNIIGVRNPRNSTTRQAIKDSKQSLQQQHQHHHQHK